MSDNILFDQGSEGKKTIPAPSWQGSRHPEFE